MAESRVCYNCGDASSPFLLFLWRIHYCTYIRPSDVNASYACNSSLVGVLGETVYVCVDLAAVVNHHPWLLPIEAASAFHLLDLVQSFRLIQQPAPMQGALPTYSRPAYVYKHGCAVSTSKAKVLQNKEMLPRTRTMGVCACQ